MDNIIIVEPWDLEGLQHAEFNSNLIKTINLAYPSSCLFFFGSERNFRAIGEVCRFGQDGEQALRFLGAPPFDGARGLHRQDGWLRALNRSIRNIQPVTVFLLSLQGYSLHLAVKLLALSNDSVKFRVILHWASILIMPIYQSLGKRLRFFLFSCWYPNNIEYIVLSKHVVNYCIEHVPRIKSRVNWINHPLPKAFQGNRLPLLSPIIFGFVGHPFEIKGVSIFLRLAKCFKNRLDVRFVHVGRSNGAPEGYGEFVKLLSEDGGMLTVEGYKKSLQRLHYAVFPYSAEVYADRVSGAFLDALAFEIPIIVLRSKLFESLFEEMGQIGYICDSEVEMLKKIDEIVRAPPVDEYYSQVRALSIGKTTYSVAETAARLRGLYDSTIE